MKEINSITYGFYMLKIEWKIYNIKKTYKYCKSVSKIGLTEVKEKLSTAKKVKETIYKNQGTISLQENPQYSQFQSFKLDKLYFYWVFLIRKFLEDGIFDSLRACL